MLFAQDRLTLGQASELSEMSQRQFLALLSSRQIPVTTTRPSWREISNRQDARNE